MVAKAGDDRHVAGPSGLHAALQNAAQLPYSVAAGLADEVAFQTQSIGARSRDSDVDSKQLYHESNAQMQRSESSKAQPDQGSKSDTLRQKTDYPLPHPIPGHPDNEAASALAAASVGGTGELAKPSLHQHGPVLHGHFSAAKSSEDMGSSQSLREKYAAKLKSADTGSTITEHTLSPKKSVSIRDTVDVAGEGTADHRVAQSHLVAAKDASADDSNSTSSSVSLLCTSRHV